MIQVVASMQEQFTSGKGLLLLSINPNQVSSFMMVGLSEKCVKMQ